MAIDYQSIISDGSEVVEEAGRTVVFKTRSQLSDDAAKPWRSTASLNDTTVATVKAVLYDVDIEDVDGEKIKLRDERCLVMTGATLEAEYVLDGVKKEIISTEVIKPGDTIVALIHQLRRSGS